MALYKTMKTFLSPVLSQEIRFYFQQSQTLVTGRHRQIKCRLYNYHHCVNCNRIQTGKYMKCLKKPLYDLKASKMSLGFPNLPISARNVSPPYLNCRLGGTSFTKLRSTKSHGPLSAELNSLRMQLPLLGNLVKRHRHKSSDTGDSVDYKEFPLLFRHKTKKPASSSSAEEIGKKERKFGVVEVKKRVKKKQARVAKQDMLICSAYATADAYYLPTLKETLLRLGKFLPVKLPQDADGVLFMHLVEPHKDLWQDEPSEIVFFEEGTVVFWNATPTLESEILWILEYHQRNPYEKAIVQEENEKVNYRLDEVDTHLNSKGIITLDKRDPEKLPLEKFAFSNAMMHSVKLAIWEDSLDHFVDSIEYVPDHMSLGKPINMSREEVMKKRGKLFALRHCINLSSDLLIASDFYWDRDNLESLYQKMCQFYSINRRTKVMNEKLTHCSELVELMRTHLSEKHSTRLEWMIIILIAVEVVFEFIHYIKLYLVGEAQSHESETHSQDSPMY